ncbi:microsomal glutathione S-transferase 1 isoform X1 [Anoplophora glabripennis]|uniref:microsomal glutathione S-transferase 1 isoform X1 n=1 Tax=Anoplophora glabripennis TaxID=217634 RepID=UPI000874E560|nr:microsomal glutathione S-transferase 1 isoform X1 [Anoplophora glabripennis]
MAEVVTEGLSLDNPLVRVYAFYCSILVLKMMFMSVFTSMTRVKTKAYANPEDAARFKLKVKQDDNVERVRRAHLNDLENIPIFFIVSLIYILTNPSYFLTTWLFRAFTLARISHTFVYAVVVIPQPARGLSWATGFFITGYMAIQNVIYFLA